jgi:hypothetical protein
MSTGISSEIRKGLVSAHRVGIGHGTFLIPESEVIRLRAERGLTPD